jgi:hypothetical protein
VQEPWVQKRREFVAPARVELLFGLTGDLDGVGQYPLKPQVIEAGVPFRFLDDEGLVFEHQASLMRERV